MLAVNQAPRLNLNRASVDHGAGLEAAGLISLALRDYWLLILRGKGLRCRGLRLQSLGSECSPCITR